jgi:UDP-2-acetamido-2,6-beta-L-arabino-hexul-4-ose reductase
MNKLQVLVTGADGFIGKNLCSRLEELGYYVHKYVRGTSLEILNEMLEEVTIVFHLAGVNRPKSKDEFKIDNEDFTRELCNKLSDHLGVHPRDFSLVFASSVSAVENTPYGLSKKAAEEEIAKFSRCTGSKARILRLPNIFGKGCRPNYNSVVATFCKNAIAGEPLEILNQERLLNLLYVDDLVDQLLVSINSNEVSGEVLLTKELDGCQEISVGDLATKILKFDLDRRAGILGATGSGFDRKLFATYISYLPVESFVYKLAARIDSRGSFAEFIKTHDSGQVSVFKCIPGEIRGRHYHNTKSEQFLLVQGTMRVRFENIYSGEQIDRIVSGENYEVIWAIPGWSHSFENIGESESIAIVWANEVFDLGAPDTYSYPKDSRNNA